jgi:hypothetical protein
MTNPYGDGHAAEKIVQVLTTTPLAEELLVKRAPSFATLERTRP